jgi:DNA polymerase V
MGLLIVMRPERKGPVLPYYEARVPAGFPSPADDYLERPLDLSEYLATNRAATFLMRVEGDSMTGAGILDGDLLVIDRSAKVISGSVIVVALDGKYTVERLRRSGSRAWLDPANPRFSPVEILAEAELHVFGVVRHAIHTL